MEHEIEPAILAVFLFHRVLAVFENGWFELHMSGFVDPVDVSERCRKEKARSFDRAETPGNFGIYLNQIRKVKYSGTKVLFGKGGLTVGMNLSIGLGGGDDDDKPAKLEIETIGGKYEFEIVLQFQQQTYQVLKAKSSEKKRFRSYYSGRWII